MAILTPRFFGNRKTPKVPIGTSGVFDSRNAKITNLRFSLSYTFTGLTPGVRVTLLDNLFVEETNNIFKANIVRTGTVNEYGQITFEGLRDSIYSLIVNNLENAGESIYNVPIGDPKRFDTLAQHTIPSQPQIYSVSVEDLGLTAQATVLWRQGADGVKGFPELFYSLSGATSWTLFNRWEDENVYSAVVGPLEFDSTYQIRVHLLNEDMLPGPWSNTVYVATPTTPVVSGNAGGYSEEVLFLDFETAVWQDRSLKNNTLYNTNIADIDPYNRIFGKHSYLTSTPNLTIIASGESLAMSTNYPYNSFVFEGTFQPSGAISLGDSLGFFGSSGKLGFALSCRSGTNWDTANVVYGNATLAWDIDAQFQWAQNKRKHLVVTYDASKQDFWSASIHLDGILIASGTANYGSITDTSETLKLLTYGNSAPFIGLADNIRLTKSYGGVPVNEPTPFIKATVPAKGVIDTGNTLPRIKIDSRENIGATSPTLEAWDSNGARFFALSAESGIVYNSGVTEGYFLRVRADGSAYWANVSGAAGASAHKDLTGLTAPEDDHTQYSHVDGRRAFTAEISGVTPIGASGLVTKIYVDTISGWSKSYTDSRDLVYSGWAKSYVDNSLLYNTSLSPSLAMPSGVGGLPAGTKVEDILGDSFITMFDNILFPTVLATVTTNPYVILTGVSTTTLEIGTAMAPSLTATFNSGVITNGDGTVGPGVVGSGYSMVFRNPADATIATVLPTNNIGSTSAPAYNIVAGSNTWDVRTYYVSGTGAYYDNKNNAGTNLNALRVSGSVADDSNIITGRYRYWYSTGIQNSHPTDSAGVRALNNSGFLSSTYTATFDISIPATTQEVYFYTYSGKTATVTYTESSSADVTGSFIKFGIVVNDNGGTPVNYEGYYSYIGAGGYPSTATYHVVIT